MTAMIAVNALTMNAYVYNNTCSLPNNMASYSSDCRQKHDKYWICEAVNFRYNLTERKKEI